MLSIFRVISRVHNNFGVNAFVKYRPIPAQVLSRCMHWPFCGSTTWCWCRRSMRSTPPARRRPDRYVRKSGWDPLSLFPQPLLNIRTKNQKYCPKTKDWSTKKYENEPKSQLQLVDTTRDKERKTPLSFAARWRIGRKPPHSAAFGILDHSEIRNLDGLRLTDRIVWSIWSQPSSVERAPYLGSWGGNPYPTRSTSSPPPPHLSVRPLLSLYPDEGKGRRWRASALLGIYLLMCRSESSCPLPAGPFGIYWSNVVVVVVIDTDRYTISSSSSLVRMPKTYGSFHPW